MMAEWGGRSPEPASMADIGRRLRELGPGSLAVVGFDRADAPGYWFNAVKHEGMVLRSTGKPTDLKSGPPRNYGLGFGEKDMSYSDALYLTTDGKVVPSDHQ
jgi:hypothetical protein